MKAIEPYTDFMIETENSITDQYLPFQAVQAVFLDVDQTLLDFDACARAALTEAFARFHLPYSEAIFTSFLKLNAGLWDQIEEGKMTRSELQKIRFPYMFKAWNLPLEEPEGFEKAFSTALHNGAFMMPGAMEGLDYLASRRIPLFIISNGPAAGQKNRLAKAGILRRFRAVYTSGDFGCAKPDPAFFARAKAESERLLGRSLSAGRILVIGDSFKADIQGASAAGMPSIWLQANRQHDPFEAVSDGSFLPAASWKEVCRLLPLFLKEE